MELNSGNYYPEGVLSFLDTDLYKLTMQCAVLKYYRDVPVTYSFTNRTPEKKLSREAYRWLEKNINLLGNITLLAEERAYLERHCDYFGAEYLDFLQDFCLDPGRQVVATFKPVGEDTGADSDIGDVDIKISGTWVDTILYEIPILALTSEAYFKFMDRDWDHDKQDEKAEAKAMKLLEAGCIFSEFGTRRRRDYHTQALVFRGLTKADKEAQERNLPGKFSGTSNVHLAMRFNIPPIGTVAHEWFMGIAAITGDYKIATEEALCRWVDCFGEGTLGIALTDTFGTPEFLKAFSKPLRHLGDPTPRTKPDRKLSIADTFTSAVDKAVTAVASVTKPATAKKTYAEVFTGVRQDSGDPKTFVKVMRKFYDEQGIHDKKVIVFSDSLNIERCLEYKTVSEEAGFKPTFGVGTFLTNDFVHKSDETKSTPLNIVIKLSSAAGRPAIKISDNAGKNTGDKATVDMVKRELGYVEKDWVGGDETARWGREDEAAKA